MKKEFNESDVVSQLQRKSIDISKNSINLQYASPVGIKAWAKIDFLLNFKGYYLDPDGMKSYRGKV